jgi:nucleoid-associated protein YgaU
VAVQPALAQQPTQAQPKQHVVREGDTLWDLARTYFNDPFRWPLIYDANKSLVENPHRIFPTERLVIPGLVTDAVAVAVPQVEVAPAAPTRSRC